MYAVAARQHPDVTDEMWDQIDRVIAEYSAKPGAVIPVLRLCQDIVGYLPVELIDYISHGLNLPHSDVYGVASFYTLFSMVPKGRNKIRVCMGTACYVKGMKDVLTRINNAYHLKEGETSEDRRFSLEAVRCLGACGLAPVITINDEVHGDVSSDKIVEVLNQYE